MLSKYPIKYIEPVFDSINFEKTILSTLTSQIFICFLAAENFSFVTLFSPKYQHYYTKEKIFVIMF